jgi:chorismate synthase
MLRLLTGGESHGPELTAILDGIPAGLALSEADIAVDLARRQEGYGRGGRMAIEQDSARITGGVMTGLTTGGPIALTILNRDWRNWRDKDIEPLTVPRPGHADLTGAVKYGYRDLRLSLERASARETAARTAAGAICRRLLAEFGITVGSYVIMIGGVSASLPANVDEQGYLRRFEAAEASEVRCPDEPASALMHARVKDAIQARDTLGGIFEVVALGVPPGLGSYVQADRRLDARLLWAMGTVPAVKGAEIGAAFEQAALQGTQVHDAITRTGQGALERATNRAGGLEGGITTGQPIVVRAAMKPISTTLTPIASVDLATGQPSGTNYERSDFCAVPRAAVVGEAVVVLAIAAALLEKLGGDSLDELRPRFSALRHSQLSDLPMDNRPWRFGYSDR